MLNNDFFTVNAALAANIEPLSPDVSVPDRAQFCAEIPAPFMAASEFSQLEQLNEAAKHELAKYDLQQVIRLLETQNAKFNLLLNFMLSQQDAIEHRHTTVSFGAGQLSYLSHEPLQLGQLARVKLFLNQPAAGIYCYGQVEQVDAQGDQYLITIKFVRILEDHQDLLIKAALYQQQKLLRQRSLDRDNK